MSFRQVDQRHVQAEISLMQWSPTMDLIAVASQGEVSLHRMSWQKVWSLAPSVAIKADSAKVTCLVWRPDGRVLAAAYKCGKLALIDIENAEILHIHDFASVICSLYWTEHKLPKNSEAAGCSFYEDRSSTYLPKNYSSAKTFGASNKQSEEPVDDCKKIKGQTSLNILVAGTSRGLVYLYAFGIFPCGWFTVDDIGKGEISKVVSVALSDDLSVLATVLETPVEKGRMVYTYRSFDVPLLHQKAEELKVIALKLGQISSLMSYLDGTIRAISEAWEDILLEIDMKLLKYAEDKRKVSDGSISDDFLELLMFGTPSNSLENFLLHDLTENGLKKFGHSVELAYSNIQKLVLKKLQNVAMSLFYHLGDVKGMLLWEDKFGELNLSYDALLHAMSSVGSFLMKAIEIQQVIDSSMKNFKAFFRWLYAVILRLSDEPVPPEITKVTQQDLNFVAEFLRENFSEELEARAPDAWEEAFEWCPFVDDTPPRVPFKLERIGQYLKDEPLSFPPSVSGNPWVSFIRNYTADKDIKGVTDSDLLFPYHPGKSLVQQHAEVCKSIEQAFNGMWNTFRNTVSKRNSYDLWTHYESQPFKMSHATCFRSNYLLTMFQKEGSKINYLYILQESLVDPEVFEGLAATFGELPRYGVVARTSTSRSHCPSHSVIDAKFYNVDTITVLLMECSSPKTDCPVLVQMQLKAMRREMKPVLQKEEEADVCANLSLVEGEAFVDKSGHKRLENMKAVALAVSGPRKVASVLFSSRRQVRVYEMEVEEEDEDSDDIGSESDEDLNSSGSQSNMETGECNPRENSAIDEPLNLAVAANGKDVPQGETPTGDS